MSLQEKSEEKCSLGDRLKNLRLVLQCEWAELANKLGLSESMIYAVRAGRVGLSDKAVYRLEQMEAEVNLQKVTKAAGVVAEAAGGSEADQSDLFNRLVLEYSELKDKMASVAAIIERMGSERKILSYRAEERSAQEKQISTRAQIGVAKVLGEAQRAGVESGSSQKEQSTSDKGGGPGVPSPGNPGRRRTPPKPAPK